MLWFLIKENYMIWYLPRKNICTHRVIELLRPRVLVVIIAEAGTHESLLHQNGRYAEMYLRDMYPADRLLLQFHFQECYLKRSAVGVITENPVGVRYKC